MNLFLSLNDTVIPYENAQQTYAKAGEPKELKRKGAVVVPIRERNDTERDVDVIKEAIKIVSKLREFFPTHIDVMSRSLSAQLSHANAINASFVVFVGKNELKEGKLTLRNLGTGEQEKMGVEECVERIKACFDDEK